MGITGLLPLLKSIHKPCNLKKFAGQTIGVDAYGWLHRGTVACAIDLALGKPTTKYVDFSINRVRMLIHFGVTPYLVFDGDNLPSKAATEEDRAKRREESTRIGLELYRLGKISQAHKELQKAVDVTPEMAGQLIAELRKLGVQYVVAPYEADAQLVYLESKGLTQGILSEDSDLLVFGAKCLLTKLNQYGECVEINRDNFTACRDISLVGWSDNEFRLMAILSGCDYLQSISNMGLMTAYRLVRKYKTIEKILRMLEFDGKYYVPKGYLEAFRQAELTFLHQRVFCPLSNDLSMIVETKTGSETEEPAFIGARVEKAIAIKVANGDLHPTTKMPLKVPGFAAASPRTPLSNSSRRDGVKYTDMKENKSIESFFKAKRTPLAELDPNSFTPSPSQQRLQHQSNATWMSSPAPSRPAVSASSAFTSATGPSGVNSVNNHQVSISAPHPRPKRRRLCSDLAGDHESPLPLTTRQEGRSKFFASTKSELTTGTTEARRKKATATDITIWSDDSIEDVMAGLPDVGDHVDVGAQPKKLSIFQEKEEHLLKEPSLEAPSPEEPQLKAHPVTLVNEEQVRNCLRDSLHEESNAHDSQSSISTRVTDISETSVDTAATSISSSTQKSLQPMNEHVKAELTALHQRYSYAPIVTTTPQQRQLGDLKIKPGDYQKALQASGKPLLRHGSLTPLQRLGASALNRDPSWSGSSRSTPKQAANRPGEDTPDAMGTVKPSPLSNGGKDLQSSETSLVLAVGPDLPTIKGSEDLIVPDSEEEQSDALSCSDVEDPTKPRVNLGRFAFSG